MKKIISRTFLFCVANIFFTPGANAENPTATAEMNAGLEQDSNLNVIEIDRKSGQSDLGKLFNAKADVNWKAVNDKLSVSGGYAYSGKTYQDNSDFNLVIQQLSADANYDLSAITAGTNYFYASARLGGKDFLVLRQSSAYVSKLINDRFYIRAAANIQDKKFADLSARNATNNGVSVDSFLFFNQARTFLAFNITTENENASAREFDYKGSSVKARISHKFTWLDKDNKVQAGIKHFKHDYSGITPELGSRRFDSGNSADAEWEINLSKHLSLTTKVERGNYNSNLAAADYTETRASFMVNIKF